MIEKNDKHRGKGTKVTFSIPREWLDRPVSLVGEFNDWDREANPMRKRGGNWTTSVVLEPGRRYRFRYVDSWDRWHDDPAADDLVPNGEGTFDCIVDLSESDD